MTTPTQSPSEPAKAKTVQPPPAPRAEPEVRRPSAVGRFFSRLLMLMIAVAISFVAGYYVMDQEARMHREAFQQEQSAAQDRIAALEEQIREMQLSRLQENSVEIDLTNVFAPIKAAVSRLAEAQMTLVAQQISAEVTRRVDTDVENLNASAPIAAIAEAAVAAIEPAIATMPPSGTTAEAPRPREPAPELPAREPPGDAAAEPAAGEPGSGAPAADAGSIAPGDAASEQPPAAELSSRALPAADGGRRLPQWLLHVADTLDNARSRLDGAASAPAPGLVPASPTAPRF